MQQRKSRIQWFPTEWWQNHHIYHYYFLAAIQYILVPSLLQENVANIYDTIHPFQLKLRFSSVDSKFYSNGHMSTEDNFGNGHEYIAWYMTAQTNIQ